MTFDLDPLLQLWTFGAVLVFARIGAALMLLPGFGDFRIPRRLRLLFAMALTILVLPAVSASLPAPTVGLGTLLTYLLHELAIGLFIGATTAVLMSILHMSGAIIAGQIGLSNALSGELFSIEQGAAIGAVLSAAGLLVIFLTGLDHLMLTGLVQSYERFPVAAEPQFQDMADIDGAGAFRVVRCGDAAGGAVPDPGLRVQYRPRAGQPHDAAIAGVLRRPAGVAGRRIPDPVAGGAGPAVGLCRGVRASSCYPGVLTAMSDNPEKSEKTEAPTQRRIDEARQKGNLPLSRDVSAALVLGATTGFLALLGGRVLSSSSSALWPLIESPDAFQLGSAENVMYLLSDLGIAFAWIAGPLMAVLLVMPVISQALQNGLIFSAEKLQPKFERISPIAGFKRLVSIQALVEFIKGLLKLTAVGIAAYMAVRPHLSAIMSTSAADMAVTGRLLGKMTIDVLIYVCVVLVCIAALGFRLAALFLVAQPVHDPERPEGGNAPERRQSGDQGAHPGHPPPARPPPHDGRRAAGDRRHHQPDPLCRGAVL